MANNNDNEFLKFINTRKVATGANDIKTHTSFKGGTYWIDADNMDKFFELYHKHNGGQFGIVEYPKMIRYVRFDLDIHFKKPTEINEKYVQRITSTILRNLDKYTHTPKDKFNAYILMRPKITEKNGIYKNGIHIQIPEFMTKSDDLCNHVRNELIKNPNLKKIFKELNVINPIEDIFDECIYDKNGWMMYGSDKIVGDNSNAYTIKYVMCNSENTKIKKYDNNENVFDLIKKFSLRNKMCPKPLNNKGDNIIEISREKLRKIEDDKKQQQEERKRLREERKNENINLDKIADFVKCLNKERANHYQNWSKVGWCLKSIDNGLFNVFDEFSKLSDKYDENNVEKFWDNSKDDGDIGIGSLIYWAKNDNPDMYKELMKKYEVKQDINDKLPGKWTSDGMAKHFATWHNDSFIFQDEVMYFFNGVYWKEDIDCRNLKAFLCNHYANKLAHLSYKIKEDELSKTISMDKMKIINDRYSSRMSKIEGLDIPSIKKDVVDCSKLYLTNDDIEFDANPYIFCFKNKVWDLTKGEFINPNPLDYMTLSTGYNYEEDEDLDENMKVVDKFIKEVLPNIDVRECALKIIASGMSGRQLDKFTIFNGGGGNGKGVLDKLTLAAFGKYAYKVDNSILTEKKNKSGGVNPAKANLHKKRYVISTEPNADEGEKFNCSTIKEITGEKTLDGARMLYSKRDYATLQLTLICECNKKPPMKDADNAIIRRIMDILFESTFTEHKEDVDEKNGIYPINKSLDTDEWREKYKIAMFHYLQPYFMKLYNDDFILNTPQLIKERNEKYLADSNEIFSWFKSKLDEDCEGYEYIQKTDDSNDFIKIADLYNMFKHSTYFSNLNKKERRELTKSNFIDKIIEIRQFRKVYKERLKIIESNTTRRNILTNFKIIGKNDIVDNDDEF